MHASTTTRESPLIARRVLRLDNMGKAVTNAADGDDADGAKLPNVVQSCRTLYPKLTKCVLDYTVVWYSALSVQERNVCTALSGVLMAT